NAGDNTTMAPWAVLSGSVDVVNNGFWAAYQGANSLDLAGSTGNGGHIAQTFPTSAGATYVLSFAYANNTYVDSADVLATGKGTLLHTSVTHSGSTYANMNYVLFSQSFVADSSSATLQFTETNIYSGGNNGNYGIVLDDVSV